MSRSTNQQRVTVGVETTRQEKAATEHFLVMYKLAIDRWPELKDSGLLLDAPGGPPLLIRKNEHASGLETYIAVTLIVDDTSKVAERSWWDRWNGVVLNCGATVAGGVATAVSCGATPFTAGASTPLCVASVVSTTATATQCTMSVAKETSDDFAEYIQSDDGQWINYADLGLDLLSLGIGVASLPGVLKSGSKMMKTYKYANFLGKADKGKLTKTLAKLEKIQANMGDLTKYLDKGLKLSNPAAKAALTNNIVKRMLPQVMKQLKREQLEFISATIAVGLSTASSLQGGVGTNGWGLLKVAKIGFFQFLPQSEPD